MEENADMNAAPPAGALMAPLGHSLMDVSSPRKKKKKKKKNRHRDPNAPRQPMNSYNIFVKEHRQQVVATQQFKDNPEIMREMSRIWRELNPEQRKVFDDMADKDRQRFEEEMKHYAAPKSDMPGMEDMAMVAAAAAAADLGEDTSSSGQKKRRVATTRSARRKRQRQRDPAVPKFPLNPYNIFVKDVRASVAKASQYDDNPEVMKEISRMWRGLPAEEKQHYRDLSEKDKERYEAEQLQYYKAKADQQSSADVVVDIANAMFPGGVPAGSAGATAIQTAILSAAATAMAAAMQSQRGDGTPDAVAAAAVPNANPNHATVPFQGLAALQALIQQQLAAADPKALGLEAGTEADVVEHSEGSRDELDLARRKDDGVLAPQEGEAVMLTGPLEPALENGRHAENVRTNGRDADDGAEANMRAMV